MDDVPDSSAQLRFRERKIPTTATTAPVTESSTNTTTAPIIQERFRVSVRTWNAITAQSADATVADGHRERRRRSKLFAGRKSTNNTISTANKNNENVIELSIPPPCGVAH